MLLDAGYWHMGNKKNALDLEEFNLTLVIRDHREPIFAFYIHFMTFWSFRGTKHEKKMERYI